MKVQDADDGVADVLSSAEIQVHVARGPSDAVGCTVGGQFAHEVGRCPAAGVPASLDAQHGDAVVGDLLVVDPEVVGSRDARLPPRLCVVQAAMVGGSVVERRGHSISELIQDVP